MLKCLACGKKITKISIKTNRNHYDELRDDGYLDEDVDYDDEYDEIEEKTCTWCGAILNEEIINEFDSIIERNIELKKQKKIEELRKKYREECKSKEEEYIKKNYQGD